MAPKLYMVHLSPPVRAVLLFEKALGIELEHIEMDLLDKKEHLTPEYLKLNPQHTVPTLVDDDGTVVWDSHAIMIYLIEKYGRGDALYPKDIKKRAVINQRLFFESGVLFPALIRIIGPILQGKSNTIPEDAKTQVHIAYDILNKFLDGRQWVAGEDLSVADFSTIATVTTLNIVVPHENKYPNISAWLKKAQDLSYYSANRVGLEIIQKQASTIIR